MAILLAGLSERASDRDVTRRTLLAAERTWLAWWRSGIAAAAAAVAVGGVVPELVDSARTAYLLIGAGYAALAVTLFLGAGARQREVGAALERGGYADVGRGWLLGLTGVGALLALATFVVILLQL